MISYQQLCRQGRPLTEFGGQQDSPSTFVVKIHVSMMDYLFFFNLL